MFCNLKKLLTLAAASLFTTTLFAQGIVLTEKNSTFLRGEVSGKSIGDVIGRLESLTEREVYLVIDSPGGSVMAGNELVDYLRRTTKKVTCLSKTSISMAFVILQACHKRVALESGIQMQHVPSFKIQGDAPNNFSMANFLSKLFKKMDTEQANRIGISLQEFRKKTRNDWWTLADEAKASGIVDSVERATCAPELYAKRDKQTVTIFIFTINVTYSGCPLVSVPLKVESDADTKRMSPKTKLLYQKALDSIYVKKTVDDIRTGKRKSSSLMTK